MKKFPDFKSDPEGFKAYCRSLNSKYDSERRVIAERVRAHYRRVFGGTTK